MSIFNFCERCGREGIILAVVCEDVAAGGPPHVEIEARVCACTPAAAHSRGRFEFSATDLEENVVKTLEEFAAWVAKAL